MLNRTSPRPPVGAFSFLDDRGLSRAAILSPASACGLSASDLSAGGLSAGAHRIRGARHLPLAVLLAVALILIVACGGESTSRNPAPQPTPLAESGRNSAARTSHGPEAAPARIVSLAPNLTEILFALGLGDRVVGDTDYCNYPPEAARLTKVGGFVNPNPESIVALRPDLVVATPNVGNRPFVERLMATGARVEVVQARNVEEIFPAVEAIARACGVAERGRDLAAKLRADLARQRARVGGRERPRTLFCLQIEPLLAAGPGSYPGDLIAMAGGANIVPASAGSYPSLSLEQVVRAAPEVIVQTLMDTKDGASGSASLVAYWSRWASIPAVRSGRIQLVPGDLLLRPGPRVAEAVASLIAILHPELTHGALAPGPSAPELLARGPSVSDRSAGDSLARPSPALSLSCSPQSTGVPSRLVRRGRLGRGRSAS